MNGQDERLGHALRRMFDVAAQDENGRLALLELAAAITEIAEGALPRPLAEEPVDEVVPIDQQELAALVERASAADPGGADGPLAAAIRAAAAVAPVPTDGGVVVPPGFQDLASIQANRREERQRGRDSQLPGLAERSRAKAELTRSLANHAGGGPSLDLALLHRARSVGAIPWMADVGEPDARNLERLADCYAALADVADYITFLPRGGDTNGPPFATAVQTMAAITSALRVAVLAFRRTADEEQLAAFDWLKATTDDQRIFVSRYMRLEDPFDPDGIPSLVTPLRVELAELKAAEARREARRKALGQLRYHAGLLSEGYGTDHDREKVCDAVEKLVAGGMPPSSLDLRNLLVPVRSRLQAAEDEDGAYGRVLAELDAHVARQAVAPDDDDAEVSYSAEVSEVAQLLAGTSMVLIGGARRVEAEAAILEAFGLRAVNWMSIEDDPTPEQFERAFRREDVSVVLLLVRWARHAYADSAGIADRYGKPFVNVEGGYNPNGLAHDILEQASDRLRRARANLPND